MEKRVWSILSIGLVLLMVMAGNVWAQTPPPWMSYSPPESFYMGLDAAGSYQYFDDQFLDNRGNVNHGNLKLRFWLFKDSPTYGFDMNAALNIHTKGIGDEIETDVDLSLNSGGYTSLKYYLSPLYDAFGYLGLTGTAADLEEYSLVGNVGLGFGRFKDVTPLGRAAEIERALMAIEDVDVPFGPEFLVALAQETETFYDAEETEAERTERIAEYIISNAPGHPDLSPAGVITINEVLNQSILRRSVGWEVRAGIGYPILPADQDRDIQAVMSASLGMPIAYGTQVNLSAQATSPFEDIGDIYTVGLQGELVHTVNDNLDVGTNVSASLSDKLEGDSLYSYSLGAFADLQIFKSLTMVTTVTYSDATEVLGSWEEPTINITTSLRYRLF